MCDYSSLIGNKLLTRQLGKNLFYQLGYGGCTHPGCRNHVSHPCEGCGGQVVDGATRFFANLLVENEKLKDENKYLWKFTTKLNCNVRDLVSENHTLKEQVTHLKGALRC